MTLKQHWAAAGILLAVLAVLGFTLEYQRPTRLVFDQEIALLESHEHPSQRSATARTDPFSLSGPTTLRITQRHNDSETWIQTRASLIEITTGDIREATLVTVGPNREPETHRATLDAIPSGEYSLRFDSRSPRPPGGPAPTARVRAVLGTSTPWAFLLAAFAILAPPTGATVHRLRQRRKSPPASPSRPKSALVT